MRDARLVADILKVDHAGECGAIQIYTAQIWVAKWLLPNLSPLLQQMLEDERSHRLKFQQLMDERAVAPCFLLGFWGIGGFCLGLVTGCLGREAVWICTASVERAVHRHLDEQLEWLASRDPAVAVVIKGIQVEELEHLRTAETQSKIRQGIFYTVLDTIITAATEALIWLSTYGASARILKRLAHEAR